MYAGRVPEGLALLDEAMVGISTGEVSPIFAGSVLLADRGVPGGLRLRARRRVDPRPHRVDRRAARPGPLHRAVRGAPRADHAAPRRLRRGARGIRPRRASATSIPRRRRPAGLAHGRGRQRPSHPRRPRRGRGGLRTSHRLRLRAPARPGAALARAGPHRGRDQRRPPPAGRAAGPGPPLPAAPRLRSRCCSRPARSRRRGPSPTSWPRSPRRSGARHCRQPPTRRERAACSARESRRGRPGGAQCRGAVAVARRAVRRRTLPGAPRTRTAGPGRRRLGRRRARPGTTHVSGSRRGSGGARRASGSCIRVGPAG